jgi:adenylate kinase family enzyme
MHRINIIGTTGSGKTTVSRELATRLGVPHVELDALYWRPNWAMPSREEFRARVVEALNGDSWVVDGNYGKVRDIVWTRADTLVWLDYALLLILRRLLVRTVRRVLTGEVLWSGNRERVTSIFSRDSIFLWALKTYRRRRREYAILPQQPDYMHLNVIRLSDPKETHRWLSNLEGGNAGQPADTLS